MHLDVLPTRSGGAAENMAIDFLCLRHYPDPGHPRVRHYDWHRPAFTFGYSQKIEFVRAQLPPGEIFELCRRPTGGGLVDHRNDWTYALALPRGHALADERAATSYRLIHDTIARVLVDCGAPAVLQETCAPDVDNMAQCPGGICFARAELYDVIDPESGEKIAGAAQKRTKEGLLFQGSISRTACPAALDWSRFENTFFERLAALLHTNAQLAPFPEFPEGSLDALTEQYAAIEWIESR